MKKLLLILMFCLILGSCGISQEEFNDLREQNETLHKQIEELSRFNNDLTAAASQSNEKQESERANYELRIIDLEKENNELKESINEIFDANVSAYAASLIVYEHAEDTMNESLSSVQELVNAMQELILVITNSNLPSDPLINLLDSFDKIADASILIVESGKKTAGTFNSSGAASEYARISLELAAKAAEIE